MKQKQAIVVGLGQFGMSLCRALTAEGVEVLAVDLRKERVQQASEFVAQAICLNATDTEAMSGLSPATRDICICAIGEESREGSILVTALLRQLGARRVVARAVDDLLSRILSLVGAHEVINPERAFGEWFARRLVHTSILDEIPLGRDLVVSEVRVRSVMAGRSLAELALPRRFELTVLGVRTDASGRDMVLLPDPHRPLQENDTLVVVGRPGAATALSESW